MTSIDKSARLAGVVYLGLVLTAPLSLIYIPGKLIVRGAFRWAQPILFAELATLLWLLIKGAKVPTDPSVREGVAFPAPLSGVKTFSTDSELR